VEGVGGLLGRRTPETLPRILAGNLEVLDRHRERLEIEEALLRERLASVRRSASARSIDGRRIHESANSWMGRSEEMVDTVAESGAGR
jgi:hypothetical protein